MSRNSYLIQTTSEPEISNVRSWPHGKAEISRKQNGGQIGEAKMTNLSLMFKTRNAITKAREKTFSWICKTLLTAVTYLLCGTGVGVA
jgi:hypothetical protein